MNWTTNRLDQIITHYPRGTTIDGFGDYTHDDPVELKGRWEQRSELFIGAAGNELQSEAIVYLDTDVKVGDFLFLGTATSSTANPEDEDGARQVLAVKKIAALVGPEFQRKVFL